MSSATSEPGHCEVREERLEVFGRVQGVGYRWWARQEAMTLGITGTVRNRPDGMVEIEARGTPEALDAFCRKLQEGPPASRVERVDRAPTHDVQRSGFMIIR